MKNSLNLITLYVIAFVGFTGFSFLFPVIPLYAAELGATVAEVGVIAAAISYATAFFLIPFGMLSDRFGRHKLLVGGLIIFALAPLLYPLASNPQQLILVRAVHGLAVAAFLPAAIALVVDLAPEASRGEAIGWYTTSTQLGFMTGPIIGGFLTEYLGFDAACYSCSAVSMVGLVFALARLSAIAHRPEATPGRASSSWRWLGYPLAIIVLLALLFIAIGAGTIGSYIPLYVGAFGMTETSAGSIITALYAGSAILRAPAGRLADKVDRKLLLIGGVGLSAIAVALFSFFHGLSQFIIIGVVFGIGMGIAMPASLAMWADFSPAGGRGMSMAITTCIFQVGLAAGPTGMGYVAEMSNFKTMFLVCAASLAFGLFVMVGLTQVRKA